MAEVTKHATRRTRKRLGIPKSAVGANAERALKFGVHRTQTKTSLRRYLDGVYKTYPPVNNIRVYNRHVYIFDNDILITVFPLPNKYHAVADSLEKKLNNEKGGANDV